MSRTTITQKQIEELSPQRQKVLLAIPDDGKFHNAIDLTKNLASHLHMHLTLSEFLRACYSLSQMGFLEVRQGHRKSEVKRVPMHKPADKTADKPAKNIHEFKEAADKKAEREKAEREKAEFEREMDKKIEALPLSQLMKLEEQLLDIAAKISDTIKASFQMLEEVKRLSEKKIEEEVAKASTADNAELDRLRDIEKKYTQLRELLK